MVIAAIGIGSNLENPARNVRRAIRALQRLGTVVAVSHLYRTEPWGFLQQPEFCNAAALLQTDLSPRQLLEALKMLEDELGRVPSIRWGPRRIDLDILTYGDARIDEPGLHIPHPRLHERAFALIPLADVDPRFAEAAAGLGTAERESVARMPEDPLVDRVRALAQAFLETDLMRLRIEDDNDDAVELQRQSVAAPRRSEQAPPQPESAAQPPVPSEPIKADLVGVFHFSRPQVREGDVLDGDRELAYVEALGIRNPVRSLGAGTVTAIHCKDGDAVDYGRVLFEIARV